MNRFIILFLYSLYNCIFIHSTHVCNNNLLVMFQKEKILFCLKKIIFIIHKRYDTCKINRCADTGLVPPATGVTVKADTSADGFEILIIELLLVVVIKLNPTICDVPVARPTTEFNCSIEFNLIHNCPASVILT